MSHNKTDELSSPSTPSSSIGSGHKNSLKGTKLARRARSFKDDLIEKISQIRTPTNTLGRTHSPNRRHNKDNKINSEEKKPTQTLEKHVRDIKNALKHFKDVIAKRKLEVLPGNGTIILELIAILYTAVQSYTLNENSNTFMSATTQVYLSLAKLIKLCDEILVCENENECASLNNENVKEIVDLVENAVQNLVNLANEKIKEKENITSPNSLSRPTVDVAGQRTSLPDIPLTPNERDILEKSCTNPMRASHSTESILRDSSPPPKPPLPNSRCSNPPPLPPKRRSQRSNHNAPTNDLDSSLLKIGIDRLSLRSKSPDDNSSLLSASAGSLEEETQFFQDEIDLAFTKKDQENCKNGEKISASDKNVTRDHRISNESGFISMRGSVRSASTKCSSEHSMQSNSISSSADLNCFNSNSSSTNSTKYEQFISEQQQQFAMATFATTTKQQQMSTIEQHLISYNKKLNISSNNELTEQQCQHLDDGDLSSFDLSSNDELSFLQETGSISPIPPALPIKTRTKNNFLQFEHIETDNNATLSSFKNEFPELRSNSTFNFQSKHQSMMDHKCFRDQPPPLPAKKKHIIAYMEICSASSRSSGEPMRHSVHTYNLSSDTAEHFSPIRSITHSQTMNLQHVKKQLTSQNSINSTTTNLPTHNEEQPPALPPKRQPKINCKTPTIITTPPPSPKPSSINDYEGRGHHKRLTSNLEMSTLNEEEASENQEENESQKLMNNNLKENDDVILRNNDSISLQDSSPSQSVKNDNYINLMEHIDVSDYLIFTDDGPDIKGGQLDALIVHASKLHKNDENEDEMDEFSEAFITTFRTFIQPVDLIDKLIQRYTLFHCQLTNDQKQKAVKETFSLLCRVVNDLTASDINSQLSSILTEFVYQLVCSGQLFMAKLLRNKIVEKVILYKELKLVCINNLEEQRNIVTNQPTLLDLKSNEIAEQMTLLDAELFEKIEIPEVLLFAKDQCEEKSPNLNKFTEHFNKMSYWARSQILKQDDAKDREKHVIKFIKIMKNLRKMNNYNSYLALLSALDSAPIRRLEWHKTITEGLKEYCALIDSSSSFRIYRQALAETSPPCIPYIGLVLQDLTFVHVGNPDYLKDGIINFSKRWQQHNIIVNMKRFKKCVYPFKRNERIIKFFENFENFLGEEQMWQISENIKPRSKRPPLMTSQN